MFALDFTAPVAACDELGTIDQFRPADASHVETLDFRSDFVQLQSREVAGNAPEAMGYVSLLSAADARRAGSDASSA